VFPKVRGATKRRSCGRRTYDCPSLGFAGGI
jgi:hypothetical protein